MKAWFSRQGSFSRWRGSLVIGLLALGLLVAAGGVGAAPKGPGGGGTVAPVGKAGPELPRSNRVTWAGGNYYLTGVNYPFFASYGADIATMSTRDQTCGWLDYTGFDYLGIDADFAEMQANGVHVVRWFLFGDGRGGRFDQHNYMTALDGTFYSHMDQVLDIAQRHNIYLIWSVWDFLMFKQAHWLPECSGQGMQPILDALATLPPGQRTQYEQHLRLALYKNPWNSDGTLKPLLPAAGPDSPDTGLFCPINAGGHRNIISDAAPDGAQDHFFRDVLSPILQRYGHHPNIIGWEAMNEPEWALSDGIGQNPNWDLQPVTSAQMQAYVARFAAQVHADTNQYATLGSASLKWSGGEPYLNGVNLWQGLGLDYYQVHFYGWMESRWNHYSPMIRNYATDPALVTALDAPAIVGEFPANGGQPPVYVPLIRRSGAEHSTLHLRALCQNQPQDPTCTAPITATISYYGPSGVVQGSQQVVIPANGKWAGDVPSMAGNWTGAARIEATGGIAATVEETGMVGGSDVLTFPGQETGSSHLYAPYVITGSGGHTTRLALQNPDIHPATVTLKYYNAAGTVAATYNFTLAARGSILISEGGAYGPPANFSGSAQVDSSTPIMGISQEIDPLYGVAAIALRADTYNYTEIVATLRNASTDAQTLDILNTRDAPASGVITFYLADGTALTPQPFSLAARSRQSLDLNFLPLSPVTMVITSDQTVLAQVREPEGTGVHGLAVHSGRTTGSEFFHFATVAKNADGWSTTFSGFNASATEPITVNLTLNSADGTAITRTQVIAPHAVWTPDLASIPELADGWRGSAQLAWPWPWQTGWREGFPLVAYAQNRTAAGTGREAHDGIVSSLLTWSVTGLTPREMLDRSFANNWAGGLSWSYRDTGTGGWADYLTAQSGFSAAHPAEVNILPLSPPPTAQANTPTPSYGNAATATAMAGSPTPGPACCTGLFADVPADAYFAPAVRYLSCGGFASGYACGGPGEPCPGPYYRPYNTTTRSQFSKILVLGRGWPILDSTPAYTFADVPPSHPFYLYVQTAAGRGLISGYACGGPGEPCDEVNRPYYRPYTNITRGQLAKLIVLGVGWTIRTPVDPDYTFQDVPRTQPFFGYIETLVAHGVASGYACGGTGEPCDPQNHGYFRPYNNGTRGQLSKMLFIALSNP